MFFSVLIPVYNVEQYLDKCIQSVLDQNEQDFEMILVDDGSTDSSGRICDSYAVSVPDKIRVIHKENEGLLLARRTAIQAARGDWFVHLDSDDYMFPGALHQIRCCAEKYDADLVLYKIVYGNDDPDDMSVVSKLPFQNEQQFVDDDISLLQKQLLTGGYLTAIYQKASRRDIVDINTDYHQWPGVSLMEDYLQSFVLFDRCRKAVFLDVPFVYYRYNESSITKQKSFQTYMNMLNSGITVYKEEQNYWDKWQLSKEDISKACIKHIATFVRIICGGIDTANNQKDKKILKSRIRFFMCEGTLRIMLSKVKLFSLGQYLKINVILLRMRLIGLFLLFNKAVINLK